MSISVSTAGRRLSRKQALAAVAGLASTLSIIQVAVTASPAHAASLGNVLGSPAVMTYDNFIQSPNGAYQLDMQSDGNLVEYGPSGPIWATYTSSPGAYLQNQSDGNLVIYSSTGGALWASGTNGQGAASLTIQDDGNVVDYKGSSAIWSTYTSGDTSKLAVSAAIAFARKQLGKPYRSGYAGPNYYDCSGLTSASYASAGVWIPRTSQNQWTAGQPVSAAALEPGDLVFYYSSTSPSHVAMYIGNGQIIEALKTGTYVEIDSINLPGAPVGYRRYA